jgi:hypothetical protein
MFRLLLSETTVNDVQNHFGNLVFMGCFFLVVMFIGIWWLKRNS